MNDLVTRLAALYAGYDKAYGTHSADVRAEEPGEKVEIKKSVKTIRESVTLELWQKHVDGTQPLGIAPINEQNECVFGVIDLDLYGEQHDALVTKIYSKKMPLIPILSKSGGLHITLFLPKPYPAKEVRDVLNSYAAALGVSGSEVYPKQSVVLWQRGDLGTWINMPYLGGDATQRYALTAKSTAMTLAQFVDAAEASMAPLKKNMDKQLDGPAKSDDDPNVFDIVAVMKSGPPCLQHIIGGGVPDHTRNKTAFNLALFLRKKYPDAWQRKLYEINEYKFVPSLSTVEIEEVVSQVSRKEYNYMCKDHPLVTYCNATVCRSRRYGVGEASMLPKIDALSYMDTEPPLWFAEINGARIELHTKELQDYRQFQLACMERAHVVFPAVKQPDWITMVQAAMETVERIETPRGVGATGELESLIRTFCTDRYLARAMDELDLNKAYVAEDGRTYFLFNALCKFLNDQQYRRLNRVQILDRLIKIGGRLEDKLKMLMSIPSYPEATTPGQSEIF